jgi:hypothetical protein
MSALESLARWSNAVLDTSTNRFYGQVDRSERRNRDCKVMLVKASVYWDDKFTYLQIERDEVYAWLKQNAFLNTENHMLAITVTALGLEVKVFKYAQLIVVVTL